MVQFYLTILFYVLVVAAIIAAIVLIAISFTNKSLLCAKIYTQWVKILNEQNLVKIVKSK